ATIFSTVNSTIFSQTANNASYLGGTIASTYASTSNTSATNITAGTLPWAQAPSGTVNTVGNFTLAGNITFSANTILNSTLSANGGVGTSGQLLASNGTTGAPYWKTFTSAAIGSTTQVAFNLGGTESGDANLTWTQSTATLAVSNAVNLGANVNLTTINITVQNTAAAYAGNVAVNATTIFFGNSSVNATINSTVYNAT